VTVRPQHRLATWLAPLWLAACSLAPKYEVPDVPQTDSFKEARGQWQPADPADAAERGEWWKAFGDPQLDALEAQLRTSSQDLKAAMARYEQARAVAGQARAFLYPSVSAGASATRGRDSAEAADGRGPRKATDNDFIASLDLSWEIDLFGRLRNATAAANRRVEASAGQLAALDLALQAELASTYFELRGADATLALIEDTVANYERAAELTRNRHRGGIAAATDVDQAQAQLHDALAQLAEVRLQRAQLEHAIAVLTGQPPAAFSVAPAPFVAEPPEIDAVLPSTLLERRPDVAAAEREVAAANAEIGVAAAAWFPVFGFGASGGYQSSESSHWFDSPNQFWSVGPFVTTPILDAGAISAGKRAARASYDEAVANYRQSVLTAYREVEDNLAALHHLADQVASEEAAAAAAQRSVFHANKRYSAGVADYLEVAATQTRALDAQRAALDARVRRAVAGVQLVRALGGGWTREQLTEPTLAGSP
jgi:NodT family efflux transporter outer membrane factor (OMF) lipoprotein